MVVSVEVVKQESELKERLHEDSTVLMRVRTCEVVKCIADVIN